MRSMLCIAEADTLLCAMLQHKLTKLIDDRDRIQIAPALRLAPRKQTMAAQYNTIAARNFSHAALQHHRELKARALPRQPDKLVSETLIELLHLFASVRRRSQRDSPVRMEMVNMRKRQEPM